MGLQAGAMLKQGIALGDHPILQSDATELLGEWEKKSDYHVRGNTYHRLLSSDGLCNLYAHFYVPPVVELLVPVPGWDIDWEEGICAGKRILTMRQLFSARQGLRPDEFWLPKRIESTLGAGPMAGTSIPFDELKVGYFKAMGWDPETAEPAPATFAEVGIDS